MRRGDGFRSVFPPETHLFTVANYYDHWVEILRGLNGDAAKGYDTLMIGHGKPIGFDVIESNIAICKRPGTSFGQ